MGKRKIPAAGQRDLFSAQRESKVAKDLAGLDLDKLTPLEALQKLADIKKKVAGRKDTRLRSRR